ncbi:MAG: glycoside hydrolase family 27 protein [Acidobacteriota bacterium]|nr:glycoside hydrolase family 27 protein [Acidobacteriota bacterium]
MRRTFLLFLIAATASAADLTGNWMAAQDMHDGTMRRTYLDLKQNGFSITGHIRVTQFYYTITQSTGGPDSFTLTASLMDGKTERKVTYQVQPGGDGLLVSTPRNAAAPVTEMTAHRAPAGEGAYPSRIEIPALHQVASNGLAKTPPMGWNSWNKFAGQVNDAGVRAMVDAMAINGMKEAGYQYINIDDTWQAETRDDAGNIRANNKFPDMKALADYVHSKGLKLGIYSSPGPNTCAGYIGSYGHEEQDARTWASWGIDYLKYDWCGARNIYKDEEMQAVYQKMGDALAKAGRPIVFSLCQYGRDDVWKWGPDVGGNLWRTSGDIRDTWDSMSKIGFDQDPLASWAGPGHWNDPDMLEIGNGGMTAAEERTHMSLWAMLAAPLLAGNDLQNMPKSTLEILTNRDVIAVDQDPLGKQGRRIWQNGDTEVWIRGLADGAQAMAIFNRGSRDANVTASWKDLGLKKAPKMAHDLWLHRDVPVVKDGYTGNVPAHGAVMLRVSR